MFSAPTPPLPTPDMTKQTHVCLHVVSRIVVVLNEKLENVKGISVNRHSVKLHENPLKGCIIVGIWQDGRTDMRTKVVVGVLMSALVQLHVVNSGNDCPYNICTVMS